MKFFKVFINESGSTYKKKVEREPRIQVQLNPQIFIKKSDKIKENMVGKILF